MRNVLEMIKLRKREASARLHVGPRKTAPMKIQTCGLAQLSFLELETAKEILGEVFNTTPSDVEEMIRQRIIDLECLDGAEPI